MATIEPVELETRIEYRGHTIKVSAYQGCGREQHPYDFQYEVYLGNIYHTSGPYYRRDLALADAEWVIDHHLSVDEVMAE